MKKIEVDITKPVWFALFAVFCIMIGLLIGIALYIILEPFHLTTYRVWLVFTVLFLGAAGVGLTPHLVPLIFPGEE